MAGLVSQGFDFWHFLPQDVDAHVPCIYIYICYTLYIYIYTWKVFRDTEAWRWMSQVWRSGFHYIFHLQSCLSLGHISDPVCIMFQWFIRCLKRQGQKTSTSSCFNIIQPSSQFPRSRFSHRNLQAIPKRLRCNCWAACLDTLAKGGKLLLHKGFIDEQNAIGFTCHFFFRILRQCEDLWNGKGCLLVKSDTYFSNGPKCQRLHFLNPIQRISSPDAMWPWGEAESSQAIWGEKNF